MGDFAKVIYPCQYAPARKTINKKLGVNPGAEQSNLQAEIGDVGTAQPLIMLSQALESAEPGQKIMVISFGNGCDALYFEVTENIKNRKGMKGISGYLKQKTPLDKYAKYAVWRGVLLGDMGTRAEVDLWTRWSVNWRKRKAIMGLWGGKCKKCGTVQYPAQIICVNPDCGAVNEMEDILFSDKRGRVVSYTGDTLAASYDPPAIYGSVEFDIGGKFMFDFTDCDLASMSVGMPVAFSFRRKYFDERRDIVGYFWKAVPAKEVV
jgi:uncharacterized OB-fold protein